MNGHKQIVSRAIDLFPVKFVRDHFKGTITEIIQKHTAAELNSFIYSNLGSTKQHVYLFTSDKTYAAMAPDKRNLPAGIEVMTEVALNNGMKWNCKIDVEYKVILNNPIAEVSVKFDQPVSISFEDKHVIVQFTILERNISKIVENRSVIQSSRLVSEDIILNKIVEFLRTYCDLRINDVNKGIKKIWEEDLIDSVKVEYKKNKSTATESMDGSYTLKEQYPEVYKELLKGPIEKTVFKYIIDNENFPEHFTANPSYGELSFVLYPKNPNQVKNVIDKIISSNR
ncbi:MAG TPA: hypothetical protein VGF30_00070 [Bacteroidia bacterium]